MQINIKAFSTSIISIDYPLNIDVPMIDLDFKDFGCACGKSVVRAIGGFFGKVECGGINAVFYLKG